ELAARRKRPGRTPAVDGRARAIGPALALAQVQVQAIEAAAQDQVHDRDREVIRALPLDADQADPDRRLGRVGLVDEEDARDRRGALRRRQLRRGTALRAPAGERLLQLLP